MQQNVPWLRTQVHPGGLSRLAEPSSLATRSVHHVLFDTSLARSMHVGLKAWSCGTHGRRAEELCSFTKWQLQRLVRCAGKASGTAYFRNVGLLLTICVCMHSCYSVLLRKYPLAQRGASDANVCFGFNTIPLMVRVRCPSAF